MANRLTRKVGLYFIGNMSTRLAGAILVPIYAFFVSSDSLGRYDYVTTLGQIIAPLIYVAVWEAVLRFFLVNRETSTSARRSTVVVFSATISIISIIVAIPLYWVARMDTLDYIGMISIAIVFGLVQIWQYFARAEQLTRVYMWSSIYSTLLNFILVVILVVWLNYQLLGLILSYLLSQLFIFLALEVRLRALRSLSLRLIDMHLLRQMLRYSVPLMVNLVALGLLAGIGRILIVNILGADANGVYSFAMKFATIIVSIGSVVSMSVIEEGILRAGSPGVSKFYSDVLNALTNALLLLSILSVPAIYILFRFLKSTDYSAAIILIPALVFFAILSVMSTNFGSIFMTAGNTTQLGISTVVGALVSIVSSLFLVLQFGVFGAAVGLCIGTFVTTAYRFISAKRHIHFAIHYWQAAALTVAYFALSWVLATFDRSLPIWALIVVLIVAIVACLFPLYRSIRVIRNIPDEI